MDMAWGVLSTQWKGVKILGRKICKKEAINKTLT